MVRLGRQNYPKKNLRYDEFLWRPEPAGANSESEKRHSAGTIKEKTKMAIEEKVTFCRICEATCGLKVKVDGKKLISVEPDEKHVVSQGYACVKGTRFTNVQNSPDRVTAPMKRVGEEWQEISWDQALDEIGAKIRAMVDEHGPQSFSHFLGSPTGAHLVLPIFRNAFFEGLGSHRFYGTATTDTVNKFRVNEDMYGAPMRLAFPDIEHTKFYLVIGANPAVSGNTLFHLPRSVARMKAIVKRGGRCVFVNPRRIESAQAGEHVFIRPDTDVYFLAAYCNELIQQGGVNEAHVNKYMRGYDRLREVVAKWSPEKQASVTGVSADTVRDLVKSHIASGAGALYMATGVNQGRNGTLCFWLLESINAISGNLDRRGGTLIGDGMVDMSVEDKKRGGSSFMKLDRRSDGLPCIVGQHPANMFTHDILNDSPDRIRGTIIEASNPIIACSRPDRMVEAIKSLDLVVSIDLFKNEAADLAHYILPATNFLERADLPYALQSFTANTPMPYMTYTDPVVEAPDGVRNEWWIYSRLAETAKVRMFGNPIISALSKINARLADSSIGLLRKLAMTPEKIIDGMLKQAKLPGRKEMLEKHPHGLLLGDTEVGNFLGTDRVMTVDGLVDLAPAAIVDAFIDKIDVDYLFDFNNRERFKLFGKREIKTINSWMGNSDRLVKTDTNLAWLHPQDAAQLDVFDGDRVRVRSEHGELDIPVKISDEVMPRSVAIPHGWGHKDAKSLPHAAKNPGVNSNILAGDGIENTERLSGMSHLSGILVDIEKLNAAQSAA